MNQIPETPAMRPARKRCYVYIVSSPHGGSTLFSHVLGKHPAALNLGEVSFLPKLLALGEPCSCGVMIRECDFWLKIFAEFREYSGQDLDRNPYAVHFGDAPKGKLGSGLIDARHQTRLRFWLMKVRGALDTVSVLHAPKWLGLRACSLPSVADGVANTLALYETARQVADAGLIVDASKMPRKAAHLYVAAPENVRIIHLTRDGRGVVASRKKYMPVTNAAERWYHYHQLSLRLLQRWVPEHHRIRLSYEEFASAPETSLRAVFEWLGLEYSDRCLEFGAQQPSHSAGGNPARFELSGGIRGVDDRWRTVLTPEDLEIFSDIAGAQNKAFGYE